jgi:hypothetical protein
MHQKRTGQFTKAELILASVLPARKSRTVNGKNEKMLWNGVPALKDVSLIEYLTMQICCPDCMTKRAGCKVCGGTGFVCPTCRGARFLAVHQDQDASLLSPCHDCGLDMSKGWVYDADKEFLAIERWIEDWSVGVAHNTEAEKRAVAEKERAAHVASGQGKRKVWKYG